MRLVSAFVIALFIIVSWPVVVLAQTPPSVVIGGDDDSITGRAEQRLEEAPGTSLPRPPDSVASGRRGPVYKPGLRWSAEQQTVCLDISQVDGQPDSPVTFNQELGIYELAERTPLCYLSLPAPVTLSPGAAAQQVWRDQVKLPPPEPYIAPGKAITGLRAFLEIGGPRTRSQTFNVFGYGLTITATVSSYDVDWGDGSWSRNLTSSGGPWPGGDVRHVYTTQGTYTVRVLERWTGTWSLAGGGGGNVDGTLSSEGRINSFPVVQVQAVRNR